VTATRLSNGSYRASFKIQAGDAGPATVRIAARDSSGGTNASIVAVVVS
jgi:hypothetical protein